MPVFYELLCYLGRYLRVQAENSWGLRREQPRCPVCHEQLEAEDWLPVHHCPCLSIVDKQGHTGLPR